MIKYWILATTWAVLSLLILLLAVYMLYKKSKIINLMRKKNTPILSKPQSSKTNLSIKTKLKKIKENLKED